MSKKILVRLVVLPLAMAAFFVPADKPATAAPNSIAVGVETFSVPDGGDYFALSMKPEGVAPAAGPRDIVVLFNTSASQTGEFRAKALEALKGFLAGLGAGDRVRLMAVDLNAVPLTETFVAPGGREMADALSALDARVPLGATDMQKAVDAAVDSFAGDSKNARAAVYIGDGRSAANLLGADEFAKLAARLADARIPFNSFAVGLRPDPQLLGALAVQSGGALIPDAESLKGQEAGGRLAAAADAAVLWPTSVTWPAGMGEVFPKRLPPLRSDRETVVIGTLGGKEPLKVEVAADGAAGREKFAFDVPHVPSDDNNHYLVTLVEMARIDGGVSLPLVGSASLAEARQAVGAGVRGLTRLAREALAADNLDGAERLVSEALRRDPNDADALAIRGALAKRRQGGAAEAVPAPTAPKAAPAGGPDDLNLVGPEPQEPPAGVLAETFQHDRRVIAQVINTEVRNTLNQARSIMGADPEAAIQQLKLRLQEVRQTAALDPDARDQFVDVLQAALREAARRKIDVEYSRQQRQENVAAARERLLVSENLMRDQEKVRQLMERFNSLMEEGRYRYAEEVAAVEAKKLAPNSPAPVLASLQAQMVGYYNDFMELRLARQKAVVDVLYQVEKSAVPFPDEPPIVYPDAEVWQQLTARRKDRYSAVDLAKRGTAEKKIDDALKSTTQLEFIETPLQDVIDYLKDMHKIEIQIDTRALGDVGIGTDTPVTKNLKGVSLRSALRLMLRELGLTYMIQDEVLLITTPEEAETRLSTKVYPVADLVLPIPPPMMGGMGGMGGMMGGMGGGMGGMMGGMGGGMGGMGGMGGGMGGMGGMGGGMGMFNLPRDLLPKIPEGGFRAFSVEDDLNALDNAAKDNRASDRAATGGRAHDKRWDGSSTATPTAATVGNRPAKIEIEIEKGAKPEVVWEEYFSRNEPQPKAVRNAVRRLMNEQQFDHVSALIGAALRHRQRQPWMYEALALAMEAAGRPKAEIERAVMSAVDFADSTEDLLLVGVFLERRGLNQRALQVYRQASELEPLRPEPYMLGLKAAGAARDIEGLKWASLGILSQAWPKEQANVWRAGLGVSKEVLDRLRAEKRTKEADAFLAELDGAVRRDCVIVVTWTGEADVDVLVEEPSGTVCSLRNPRTTSGGVLLGDGISQIGRDSFGGHSEAYVCPKGFDGTYRMMLRRVWGKVTTGKVNVEVITNLGTSYAVDVRKKVSLDKDEALVVFELRNGRRKEPLREQQVANDIRGQLALNRQILAQQLAAAADPRSLLGMALSRAGSSGNEGVGGGGDELERLLGANFGGAVGYQPVITVLPEGTMMMVTAVISADRRYVRITASPQFTGVAEVNVFNTASGENTTGQGGTGGQGYSGLFGGGGGGGMGGMGGGMGGMGGMGGGGIF
ncbi:MAG: hypothetical protein L6306_15270 [Planctomycetales bacterium]|nr:hypothetical protein [Planctomycetales bacterium]